MVDIKQNDIWMVSLGHDAVGHEQKGDRPFVVISSDEYNRNSGTPVGFFLSTSLKKSTNRFAVELVSGVANISQVRTLSSLRFKKFMNNAGKGSTQRLMEKFIAEVL